MFEHRLNEAPLILLDGGLATQLEAQGEDLSGDLWSAALLHSRPAAIVQAHRAYLDAGAQCIISASYQASRAGLMTLGLSAWHADQLLASSVRLAKQARNEFMQDNPQVPQAPMIAASVGPYGAFLHDGSEYTGNYDVGFETLLEFHRNRLMLLDASGADVLACETIPSVVEAKALAQLLADVTTPAWVSFSCGDAACISDGTAIEEAASIFADHDKVLAVGVNCTPPQFMGELIGRLRTALPEKPVVAYPNSGETWVSASNSWAGISSSLDCAAAAMDWYRAGARLIGGCCRMGPDHIRAMYEITRTI